MRLSKKTEYALRALIYADRFPEGTTFQIRDLAEKNGIPKKFLELILLELKNAGMLSSRRGVGAGSSSRGARTRSGPRRSSKCSRGRWRGGAGRKAPAGRRRTMPPPPSRGW